jgi:transcription initiation factor TFIIIB Brf1 subunit/transcription initiation factor TFIIB
MSIEVFTDPKYTKQCPKCNSKNIWKHLITGEYTCGDCNKKWLMGEVVSEYYVCTICGEVFESKHALDTHMEQHKLKQNPKEEEIYCVTVEFKVIAFDKADAMIKVNEALKKDYHLKGLDWMLDYKVISSYKGEGLRK